MPAESSVLLHAAKIARTTGGHVLACATSVAVCWFIPQAFVVQCFFPRAMAASSAVRLGGVSPCVLAIEFGCSCNASPEFLGSVCSANTGVYG